MYADTYQNQILNKSFLSYLIFGTNDYSSMIMRTILNAPHGLLLFSLYKALQPRLLLKQRPIIEYIKNLTKTNSNA